MESIGIKESSNMTLFKTAEGEYEIAVNPAQVCYLIEIKTACNCKSIVRVVFSWDNYIDVIGDVKEVKRKLYR